MQHVYSRELDFNVRPAITIHVPLNECQGVGDVEDNAKLAGFMVKMYLADEFEGVVRATWLRIDFNENNRVHIRFEIGDYVPCCMLRRVRPREDAAVCQLSSRKVILPRTPTYAVRRIAAYYDVMAGSSAQEVSARASIKYVISGITIQKIKTSATIKRVVSDSA